MSSPTNIGPIISAWKDIASHLGKGVRTVQRYEREFALPIRRPAGKSRASVVATTAELDAWIGACPLKESFAFHREESEIDAAASELRKALHEHRRLREQMAMLRAELRTVTQSLCENFVAIQPKNTGDRSTIVIPFEIRKRQIN